MELKYGGTLKIGDPIVVSYGSGMLFGLFAGYGRGTIQYYMPNSIVYQAEKAKQNNKKPKFYKGYVHGSTIKWRVMKVNPEVLHNEEDIQEYEKAIDILKHYNIIQ
jgi:hypothetical protein